MSKRKTSCLSTVVDEETLQAESSLPSLNYVQEKQKREEIFVKKLVLCNASYSSSKKSRSKQVFLRLQPNWIETRSRILLELIDYVSVTEDSLGEGPLKAVVNLVEEIVSTEKPPPSVLESRRSVLPDDYIDVATSFEVIESETSLEMNEWSMIQLVYELFIQILTSESLDIGMCQKYVTECFISKLFHIFRFGDIRERDYLRTIVHRIYQRLIRRRSFLRKKFNEYLFSYGFEGEPCHGIRELLEIQSSIVHGFVVPLREEHKDMLFHYLMPLHRKAELETFFPQLLSCIDAFAQKDPTLIPSILSRLCSTWPKYNSMKQILYINEVEVLFQRVTESEFKKISRANLLELSKCICSSHFQVAERALCLWNDARLIKMFATSRMELLIHLIYSVDIAIEQHWCKSVRSLALKVKENWMQFVPDFFQRCREGSYESGATTVETFGKEPLFFPIGHYTSKVALDTTQKQCPFLFTDYKMQSSEVPVGGYSSYGGFHL